MQVVKQMRSSHSSNNLVSLGKEAAPEKAKEAPERLTTSKDRTSLTSSLDRDSPKPSSSPPVSSASLNPNVRTAQKLTKSRDLIGVSYPHLQSQPQNLLIP